MTTRQLAVVLGVLCFSFTLVVTTAVDPNDYWFQWTMSPLGGFLGVLWAFDRTFRP